MSLPSYRGELGFIYIEIFNLALLARQVLRILNEPGMHLEFTNAEFCLPPVFGNSLDLGEFEPISNMVVSL
jgi:hypothetical protein